MITISFLSSFVLLALTRLCDGLLYTQGDVHVLSQGPVLDSGLAREVYNTHVFFVQYLSKGMRALFFSCILLGDIRV